MVPAHFLCPITHDLMYDPVIAEDERTYERVAITQWLTINKNSPLDPSRKLDPARLVANRAVREAIEHLMEQPGALGEEMLEAWQERKRLADMPKAEALLDEGKVTEAAKMGHPRAQGLLAQRYANGSDGEERDPVKCFEWAKLAAKGGDTYGLFRLGFAYQQGVGTTRDWAASVVWYLKAIEQGEVNSLLNLGQIYHAGGFGVTRDLVKAASWYRRGAEKGDKAACANLADCLRVGHGCEANPSEARLWFEKASDLGHSSAGFKLALMHLKGLGGERDLHDGLDLLQRAASEDKSQDAAALLKDLNTFLDERRFF